jgi:hypothetical protein
MDNAMRPRYAGVSEALPAALMVWRVGQRLLAKAERHPAARTWARVGVAGALLVGLSALAVGLLSSLETPDAAGALPGTGRDRDTRSGMDSPDVRLDEELEESFPASDAPAVTRAG